MTVEYIYTAYKRKNLEAVFYVHSIAKNNTFLSVHHISNMFILLYTKHAKNTLKMSERAFTLC